MIAPARRAAYDALLAHAVNGTDLAAAVERGSPRAHRTARPDAAHRTGQRHGAHAQGDRSSDWPAVHAAARRPRCRGAHLAAARGLSADVSGSRAGLGRGERCGGTDATRRQDECGRHGECRASRAVARSRAAGLAGRARTGGARRSLFPSRVAGRALAGALRQRANRSGGSPSTTRRPTCAWPRTGCYGTREELAQRLLADGVTTEPTRRAQHGLLVIGGPALGTEAFRDGRFVVQDEASQLITELGSIAPGQRVLDLCAAPGGKTVALATRCEPRGQVVACDVRPRRVRLLRATLQRTGRADVPVVQVAATGDLPFSAGAFDAVLVDAPCSGLGTAPPRSRHPLGPPARGLAAARGRAAGAGASRGGPGQAGRRADLFDLLERT